jgi:hypothetical protein
MSSANILHLHSYFLFPFSIDKKIVSERHPAIWSGESAYRERPAKTM